jgi:hypothetical protein
MIVSSYLHYLQILEFTESRKPVRDDLDQMETYNNSFSPKTSLESES